MVLGIQIAGVLFAAFMFYLTFLHKKRNEFTWKEAWFWMVLWVAFSFFILRPHSLDWIISTLEFGRTFDFFIVVGFMFVIGAVFYSYTILRKTQHKVEEVVRNLAIERAEQKPEHKR